MTPVTLSIYFFSLTTIVSVGVMIFTRAIFNAALSLLVALISLAGIYALLSAEFLAITQLLIYAGGVMILILFGIMLTNRIAGKPLRVESHHVKKSALISSLLMFVLIVAFQETTFYQGETIFRKEHIKLIGIELLSKYVAPFEIAGLLLLVCLIGAALMASSVKKNHDA